MLYLQWVLFMSAVIVAAVPAEQCDAADFCAPAIEKHTSLSPDFPDQGPVKLRSFCYAADLSAYVRSDGKVGLADRLQEDLAVWASWNTLGGRTLACENAPLAIVLCDDSSGQALVGCIQSKQLTWVVLNQMLEHAQRTFSSTSAARVGVFGDTTSINHPLHSGESFSDVLQIRAKDHGFLAGRITLGENSAGAVQDFVMEPHRLTQARDAA